MFHFRRHRLDVGHRRVRDEFGSRRAAQEAGRQGMGLPVQPQRVQLWRRGHLPHVLCSHEANIRLHLIDIINLGA